MINTIGKKWRERFISININVRCHTISPYIEMMRIILQLDDNMDEHFQNSTTKKNTETKLKRTTEENIEEKKSPEFISK